jgi:phosphatidylinositol glycan class F
MLEMAARNITYGTATERLFEVA